jgi:Cytochrome P450/Phosphopantetheine attachment site
VYYNFFDLGGHSFLAVRLMSQIYDKFGLLVVISAILPEKTIEPTDDDDAKFLLRIAESIKTDNNIDFSVPFEELQYLPLIEQPNLINKKANFIFSDAEIQYFFSYYKLFKLHVQAMRNYVPKVYSQPITLFRASEEIIHDFDNPEWYTDDPCIGATFALFEMKLILATILSRYELELVSQRPEHPKYGGLICYSDSGVKMVMRGLRQRQRRLQALAVDLI